MSDIDVLGRGEDHLYYEGLARGELVYQYCGVDDQAVFPLRTLCPMCGNEDLELRVSAGNGTIHSFTEQFRAAPAFRDQLPITFVLVDLDEGFRAFATLTEANDSEVEIGQRVVAGFEHHTDGPTILRFSRASEGAVA